MQTAVLSLVWSGCGFVAMLLEITGAASPVRYILLTKLLLLRICNKNSVWKRSLCTL